MPLRCSPQLTNVATGSYPLIPSLSGVGNDGTNSGGTGTYSQAPYGSARRPGSRPAPPARPGQQPAQLAASRRVLVLMENGSAKMLKNETDMITLKRYAVRDDRLVISDTVN